jgi:hypothetical protein
MHKLLALILVFLPPMQKLASENYGGIKLLDGYKINKGWAVDAATWTIYKEGGLTIEVEAGMNEGL